MGADIWPYSSFQLSPLRTAVQQVTNLSHINEAPSLISSFFFFAPDRDFSGKGEIQNKTSRSVPSLNCSFKRQRLLWKKGKSSEGHFKHLHKASLFVQTGIMLLLVYCKPFFSFCDHIWHLYLDFKTQLPYFRFMST